MFRTVLAVGVVTVFGITLYHRLKAHASREPLDRRQEGWFILLTLRPIGLLFMAGLVAYLIDPAVLAWSVLPLPDAVRWLGAVTFALGAGWWLWTLRTLGKNLTDTVVTRREHTLVTTGPYRWVRHPFYDGVGIFCVSVTLVTASWFFLVTGALVLALMVRRTRIEEQKLLERFGDAYREYQQRTGRFIPRRRPGGAGLSYR